MNLKVITPPTSMPVTLAEAKAYARITTDLDDAMVATLIAAAVEYAQVVRNEQFVTATLQMTMDGFPDDNVIQIARPPLLTVSTLQFVDTAGNLTALDPAWYQVDNASKPGRVFPAYGYYWPFLGPRLTYSGYWPWVRPQMNSVVVTYTAGYGGPADVPAFIKLAILTYVTYRYENRPDDGLSADVARSIDDLLGTDRIQEFV